MLLKSHKKETANWILYASWWKYKKTTNKKCQNTNHKSIKPGLTTNLQELQGTEKTSQTLLPQGQKNCSQVLFPISYFLFFSTHSSLVSLLSILLKLSLTKKWNLHICRLISLFSYYLTSEGLGTDHSFLIDSLWRISQDWVTAIGNDHKSQWLNKIKFYFLLTTLSIVIIMGKVIGRIVRGIFMVQAWYNIYHFHADAICYSLVLPGCKGR